MLGNWQRNIIVIFYLVGKVQITKADGAASQNLDNTCTFTVTTGFFQLCGNINDNIGIHKIIPDFEHPSWVSCPTFMCLPSPLGEGVGVYVLLCFRVVVLYWNIIISSYNCKIMTNRTLWSQKKGVQNFGSIEQFSWNCKFKEIFQNLKYHFVTSHAFTVKQKE